ncbi:MAG: hypothetical protein ACP5KZ_00735 [bacterium]
MKKLLILFFILPLLAFPMEVKLSGYSKFRYNWDQTANPESNFAAKDVRLMWSLSVNKISSLVAELNAIPSTAGVKSCYVKLKTSGGDLLFGQFKIPFGYEIPLPAALLETPDLAIVLRNLFPKQTYDKGLLFSPSKNIRLALINGNGEQQVNDDNNCKDFILHLSDNKGNFSYGVSLYLGKQLAGGQNVTKDRYGVDMLWKKKNNSLRGEVVWGKDDKENSKGWYLQYRYDQPAVSYILRGEYYNGVKSYNAKNNRWDKTENKALVFGPMFYLEKNTILSFIYTLEEGKKNDSFMMQIELIY